MNWWIMALPGLLLKSIHHRDTARQSRNQRRENKFYHEGHEEHEVKKFRNINIRNLRGLRVLRGEIVFLIQELGIMRQKICAGRENFKL